MNNIQKRSSHAEVEAFLARTRAVAVEGTGRGRLVFGGGGGVRDVKTHREEQSRANETIPATLGLYQSHVSRITENFCEGRFLRHARIARAQRGGQPFQ